MNIEQAHSNNVNSEPKFDSKNLMAVDCENCSVCQNQKSSYLKGSSLKTVTTVTKTKTASIYDVFFVTLNE